MERNDALLALIAEARCSYESLARLVCKIAAESGDHTLRSNKSTVAQWVAGRRPHPQTARYLVEALARRLDRRVSPADAALAADEDEGPTMPQDVVGALTRLGRADVDRRRFIGGLAYSIGALVMPMHYEHVGRAATGRPVVRIGMSEVNAVREMTVAFNAADERLGGGHARSAVVEYLTTDVATFLDGTFGNERVRRSMFAAAAQLAYLAGWKAHDLGMSGLAQRYYLHSFQLASESDPHAHAGYGLRILAHQAMDLGRREHCVDLAEGALARTRGKTDPQTESLFWLTVARAYAADGSPRQARGAIATAEHLIGTAGVEPKPPWAALGGPAEARLAHQAGKALFAMGELTEAHKQVSRSARCWNSTTHPRIHALTLADLAEVQCARGHVEQACETWSKALDGMAGIRSARTREAVTTMRHRLAAYQSRGLAPVRRLLTRASAEYSA